MIALKSKRQAYTEEAVRFLREVADRVESGDLSEATGAVVFLDRPTGYFLASSTHMDTVRYVGLLEWARAAAMERLLGRGE